MKPHHDRPEDDETTIQRLIAQLRSAIETCDVLSRACQVAGHVNFRSKPRMCEIARREASDARACLKAIGEDVEGAA